jgi:hypothetical protein
MTPTIPPEAIEAAARAHNPFRWEIYDRQANEKSDAIQSVRGAFYRYQVERMQSALTAAMPHLVGWRTDAPPKDRQIDIVIEGKTRWCDCYYDRICDQFRTSSPGGKLVWVPARCVTHWAETPSLPPPPAGSEG